MITACRVCGLVADTENMDKDSKYLCPRCKAVLMHGSDMRLVLAFSLTALCLMIPAMAFPFLIIQINDTVISANLFQSVGAITDGGYTAAGIAVLCTAFVFPVVFLLLAAYTSLDAVRPVGLPGAGYAAYIVDRIQGWQMVDVFLVGILVSVVKLVDMADVTLGIGFYTLMGVCFFMIFAGIYYDSRYYWRIRKTRN